MMATWISWALAAAVFAGAMAQGRRARAAEADAGAVKVLMLGDSLTHYGLAPATEKALHALPGGTKWSAIDAGVGGEAAEEGKARIGALLEKEHPQIVTVEYGPNDIAKRYKPEQFREHIAGIVKIIQESAGARGAGQGPRIVFITPSPIDATRHSFGKDKTLIAQGGADHVLETQYNAVLRQMAAEKGLGLIDMHRFAMTAKDPMALLVNDGIHLTPQAYEFIGGHIAQSLLGFYRAEVLKEPAAVAQRSKALTEAKAIEKELAAGRDHAKLEGRLDALWKQCPYLAEGAWAWHRWKYAK